MDPKLIYERAVALEASFESRRLQSSGYINLLLLVLGGFGAVAGLRLPELAIIVLTLIALVAMSAFQTDAESRAMAAHIHALEQKLQNTDYQDLIIWQSVVSPWSAREMTTDSTHGGEGGKLVGTRRFGVRVAPGTKEVTVLWSVIAFVVALIGALSPLVGMDWLGEGFNVGRPLMLLLVLAYEGYCLKLLYQGVRSVDNLAQRVQEHFSLNSTENPSTE